MIQVYSNISDAVISEDQQYRYFLSRTWSASPVTAAFIGLNPSTADATTDDPTIRRCISFAKTWGAGTLWMVNIFGFRTTNPGNLLLTPNPIGPDNDIWLERAVAGADIVIAAWGNHGQLKKRGEEVAIRFTGKLQALGLNKTGMPKHPLYIKADALLQPYSYSTKAYVESADK